MATIKFHPKDNLDMLKKKIQQNARSVLLLGPLEISPAELQKRLKKLKPSLVLVIDGGTRHLDILKNLKETEIITLGDQDSSKIPLTITLKKKKDYSDLEFAVSALIKARADVKNVTLMGFSSIVLPEERFDHLLFNLGAILKLANKLNLKITMDQSFLFFPAGIHQFDHQGHFSLLTVKSQKIKIKGKAEYTLKKWTTLNSLSTLGLSNFANGAVTIENTRELIVYLVGSKVS